MSNIFLSNMPLVSVLKEIQTKSVGHMTHATRQGHIDNHHNHLKCIEDCFSKTSQLLLLLG